MILSPSCIIPHLIASINTKKFTSVNVTKYSANQKRNNIVTVKSISLLLLLYTALEKSIKNLGLSHVIINSYRVFEACTPCWAIKNPPYRSAGPLASMQLTTGGCTRTEFCRAVTPPGSMAMPYAAAPPRDRRCWSANSITSVVSRWHTCAAGLYATTVLVPVLLNTFIRTQATV